MKQMAETGGIIMYKAQSVLNITMQRDAQLMLLDVLLKQCPHYTQHVGITLQHHLLREMYGMDGTAQEG